MIGYRNLTKNDHLLVETIEQIANGEILEYDKKDVSNLIRMFNKKVSPPELKVDTCILDEMFDEKVTHVTRQSIISKFRDYYSQFLADNNYRIKDVVWAIVEIVFDKTAEKSENFEPLLVPI